MKLYTVVFDDGYFVAQVIHIGNDKDAAIAAARTRIDSERKAEAARCASVSEVVEDDRHRVDVSEVLEDGDVTDYIHSAVCGYSFEIEFADADAPTRFVCVTVQEHEYEDRPRSV